MPIEILLLYISAAINIVLGAIVLARARSLPYSWFFALTMLGVSSWAIGDIGWLQLKEDPTLSIFGAVFYAAPMFIPITLIFFALTFPNKRLRLGPLALVGGATVALATIVGLFSSRLLERLDTSRLLNEPYPDAAPFMLYAVYFSAAFAAAYVVLFLAMRREDDLLSRTQLKYTLIGALLSSIPALLTNLTLPLMGVRTVIWAGPLFTSIFVSIIAVSIIRHKMFDIRLVVARALGYGVSVAILAIVYGFVVFGLANLLLDVQFSVGMQVGLSIAAAIAGLSFHRLQRKFDRLTNRIFFQDAYDPQELFDQLNRLLVSSLDIKLLMQESAAIIAAQLKLDYAVIGIKDGAKDYRLFGQQRKAEFSEKDVAIIRHATIRIHRNVIVADFLEKGHSELKAAMQRNNIAVLVRLTQNVRKNEEGLGYIVLGGKKSGNPYNQEDIRTLESIANELMIAIQNALHYEAIQQFNMTLQARVTEATNKLRRSNEKLKALDEAKDDFVSMASHQLRTPLTSVKGYISMVLEGDAGKINATQRRLLEQSYVSSQRMVYLIADLLNVSRLKTGKFIIEHSPVNLAEVVAQEIGQLTEVAAGRQLTLTFKQPASFPTLQLDETKTRQIIMNFVDNAIYYTPAGGHIEVQLIETPSSVELRVVDDGIGVPKSERQHLFTKFYRAGNARKARPDGTGLGLFMAKKVIVAQGGAVIFESEEGKGSTFGFVFSKTQRVD